MPVERGEHGGTMVTGNAVLGFRGVVLIQSLKLYLKTDGRMQSTRMATPSNMRAIASEFTGKPYARSRKGLVQALADMEALASGKSLDALGDVVRVNQAVGGVAADLA
jgi:hypothetical protein